MLDTSAFIPTDEQFFIKTTKTILKEHPNMDAVTVASIARSTEVTRVAKGDTWSLIRTKDGVEGYVLTASVIKELKRWTRLHCSGISNDQWYKVTLDDGTEGYVYVPIRLRPPPTPYYSKPTPNPKSTKSSGIPADQSERGSKQQSAAEDHRCKRREYRQYREIHAGR